MTRRGVILPVVLFMLLLLGLLGAMFAFRVNADLAATQVVKYRLQTKLAAEAGIEFGKLLLQADRLDLNRWYNNPDELHRIIVWGHDTDSSVWGTNEELEEGQMVYRFSLVADDPTDDEQFIRFGITDESSKLNLNVASESQLRVLVNAAVGGDEEINPQELVDAILDWRDEDELPRGEKGDTEGEYYRTLYRPYRVKNGPFDTVEELLLVKGITPEILYGEDYDRNGLLTPNEDDGDEAYPPDNEDNKLNRGLYPYLTVHSYEENKSNANRQRVYLFSEENVLREELSKVFEEEPDVVDYIVQATRGAKGPQGGGTGPGSADTSGGGGEGDGTGGGGPGDSTGRGDQPGDGKEDAQRQVRDAPVDEEENEEDSTDTGDLLDEETDDELDESEGEEGIPPGEEETDDVGSGARPIGSPAALMRELSAGGEYVRSPLELEHLAVLLDRTTTVPPDKGAIVGLININTAPPPVLKCIEGLTDEEIVRILATRDSLSSEEKETAAWLVTEEIVDLDTFERIAPFITARGQQFAIEALGYADHIGMVTRIQVIVDMVGPIVQSVYYRDLSELGGNYPIREEDLETLRVR
ncbi:MAG: general secretion pathway protein GspK [Phycisphaerales bacterium]|nr:MAG: general secretion pathway protein GspK [Phycisphaerales bacterium]